MPTSNALGALVAFSYFAAVFGVAGAAPAAAANAVILALLARRRMDGLVTAVISGAVCGVIIAPAGLHLLVWHKYQGYWGRDDNIEFAFWLAVSCGLMGVIHWLIAVRPYRRWRLHWVRGIEARAVEAMVSSRDEP